MRRAVHGWLLIQVCLLQGDLLTPASGQSAPETLNSAPAPPITTASPSATADSGAGTPASPSTSSSTPVVDANSNVASRSFHAPALNLPREHLFGDWLGVRTTLENCGITPTVTFVSDLLGNPVGGQRQGFTECDNLGLDLMFDLNKLCGLEGGKFHVSMSQRSGSSLSNVYIGNVFNVQQVFGGETFHLIDVDYKQSIGECLEFRLGRIATGDDFLASPYYWVWVQNGFDGNPVGIFKNAPGMTAYPNATWGGWLKVKPTERTYVMAGAYNGDPSIRANEFDGANLTLHGPLFAIGEAGYTLNGLPDDTGFLGHYKVGGYYNGGDFQQFTGVSLVSVNGALQLARKSTEGNYGFYFLADQEIAPLGERGQGRGVGLFAAFLVAPDQQINQMPFFFNGGVAFRGLLPSRPTDFGGFGVIFGQFSNDLRNEQRIAQRFDPSVGVQNSEIALEWTYGFRLKGGRMIVQPDIQYIMNPGAAGQIPNALVLGFQVSINF